MLSLTMTLAAACLLLLWPHAVISGRTLLIANTVVSCPQLVQWYAAHPKAPRPPEHLPVCPKDSQSTSDTIMDLEPVKDVADKDFKYMDGEGCDHKAVSEAIIAIMQPRTSNTKAGSFIRLAFHQAGTFNQHAGDGGADGACIRLSPEREVNQNALLQPIIQLLDEVKEKFPCITRADLWTLAGALAVEASGGPKIPWRPGRTDQPDGSRCPLSKDEVEKRLPSGFETVAGLGNLASNWGLSKEEFVALMGGHTLGNIHKEFLGLDGSWTSETSFSNKYFVNMLEKEYKVVSFQPLVQPTAKNDIMPNFDLSMIDDPEMRAIVEKFAEDQDAFFRAFAPVWSKFLELGVDFKDGGNGEEDPEAAKGKKQGGGRKHEEDEEDLEQDVDFDFLFDPLGADTSEYTTAIALTTG